MRAWFCAQEYVTGTVRLKLYKGNVVVVGRKSPFSLYNQEVVTFEEDSVYDQKVRRISEERVMHDAKKWCRHGQCGSIVVHLQDAGGFIKIQALRLRTLASSRKGAKFN